VGIHFFRHHRDGDAMKDLRTGMSKVKGLGSAHHGVSHWIWQRVTAIALIPLSLWFVYSLVTLMLAPAVLNVAAWFASPINTVAMALLLVALLVHAKLGVQVVIEDYVHGPFWKYTLLLLNTFACWALAAVGIVAVLKLHSLDVAIGVG
jgi:succinate dehydrogenase / fumarate reductase, membrane anchor subunit